MQKYDKAEIRTVSINSIDVNDFSFKISKNIANELKDSLNKHGFLDLPILIENNNRYIILSGHNRISAIADTYADIDVLVYKDISSDIFLRYMYLKNYRKEIGPIGKLKAVRILRDRFELDLNKMHSVLADIAIPAEFTAKELCDMVFALPRYLTNYFDDKNIGFKIIKDILSLPAVYISKIDYWLSDTDIKVNHFKAIIDYLFDIYKRDKNSDLLKDFCVERNTSDSLYNKVFRLRFPEYTGDKEKCDLIARSIKNARIDMPEFLEGNALSLSVRFDKDDSIDSIKKKLINIDIKTIKQLLDCL